MRQRAYALCLLAVLPLSGCAMMQNAHCALPDQTRMPVTQLFFGRGGVPDDAWRNFETDVIAAQFPDGFTVTNGHGAWRDRASGKRSEELSTIVTIAFADTAQNAARIQAVRAAYKARFHQQSVGALSTYACAAF